MLFPSNAVLQVSFDRVLLLLLGRAGPSPQAAFTSFVRSALRRELPYPRLDRHVTGSRPHLDTLDLVESKLLNVDA